MTSTAQLPVGQPLYGASFGQSIKRFFRGYVKFAGRASRSEFWWAMLFATIVSIVAQVPFWITWGSMIMTALQAEATGSTAAAEAELLSVLGAMTIFVVLLSLVSLALLLPTHAVMWRRLQDANLHGAFALLSLVGVGIVPLIMCALPSNPAGVQYDPAYRGGYGAAGQHVWPQGSYRGQAHVEPAYGQQVHGSAPHTHLQPVDPQASPAYGGLSYGGQPYGSAPSGGQSSDQQRPPQP